MIGFVAAAMLAVVSVAPTGAGAATGEHPGCKGIDQASSKASEKGKAALAVVSDKFGCGSPTSTALGSWPAPTGDGRNWHDNETPTCLSAGGRLPRSVELGVVEAAPYEDAPGRAVVVWLKCFRP